MIEPKRGEIWEVNFDPQVGQEIRKPRPAIVLSHDEIGRTGLRIVAPITEWKKTYGDFPWFVELMPDPLNKLPKHSAVDASQVKSVSIDRFQQCVGTVKDAQLDAIVKAVRLCIE
jgi:mRNA interferase MazF